MAGPISNDLPALIPLKTAPKPPHVAISQGTAKQRVLRTRKRKIRSCTNCRSRKLGCDKGQTCTQCKTKGLQCVYIKDLSELDKAPTRLVKKRNRRVKVCQNCRERKIPCSQCKPCRSCEDGNLPCTYQPFSEADALQHERGQAPRSSIFNDKDLQQGVNGETDSGVRELPSILVVGRRSEEAAYGRQDEQSGVNDYSATDFYGYGTAQDQLQHHYQYPHGTLHQMPELGYHHQDHTACSSPGREPRVRHSGHSDQDEGYIGDSAGAVEHRSQQYLPLMDASFHTEQRVSYNYSSLPSSSLTPVYPQPIRNHPQPPYSPQPFFVDPLFEYQEPPNNAAGPRETNEQPKPDAEELETATKNPTSNEDRPLSLDSPVTGAINGPPPQPDTVPWYRRLGAGLTLKRA